jgi:hypothetical protein
MKIMETNKYNDDKLSRKKIGVTLGSCFPSGKESSKGRSATKSEREQKNVGDEFGDLPSVALFPEGKQEPLKAAKCVPGNTELVIDSNFEIIGKGGYATVFIYKKRLYKFFKCELEETYQRELEMYRILNSFEKKNEPEQEEVIRSGKNRLLASLKGFGRMTFRKKNGYYIESEYLGQELGEYIKNKSTNMDLKQFLRSFYVFCLKYYNVFTKNQATHFDIKTTNILVQNNEFFLVDYNLSFLNEQFSRCCFGQYRENYYAWSPEVNYLCSWGTSKDCDVSVFRKIQKSYMEYVDMIYKVDDEMEKSKKKVSDGDKICTERENNLLEAPRKYMRESLMDHFKRQTKILHSYEFLSFSKNDYYRNDIKEGDESKQTILTPENSVVQDIHHQTSRQTDNDHFSSFCEYDAERNFKMSKESVIIDELCYCSVNKNLFDWWAIGLVGCECLYYIKEKVVSKNIKEYEHRIRLSKCAEEEFRMFDVKADDLNTDLLPSKKSKVNEILKDCKNMSNDFSKNEWEFDTTKIKESIEQTDKKLIGSPQFEDLDEIPWMGDQLALPTAQQTFDLADMDIENFDADPKVERDPEAKVDDDNCLWDEEKQYELKEVFDIFTEILNTFVVCQRNMSEKNIISFFSSHQDIIMSMDNNFIDDIRFCAGDYFNFENFCFQDITKLSKKRYFDEKLRVLEVLNKSFTTHVKNIYSGKIKMNKKRYGNVENMLLGGGNEKFLKFYNELKSSKNKNIKFELYKSLIFDPRFGFMYYSEDLVCDLYEEVSKDFFDNISLYSLVMNLCFKLSA